MGEGHKQHVIAIAIKIINNLKHTRTSKLTNVMVARFRKCSDLVRDGKLFVENKAKVARRVGCSERGVVYFRELWFKYRPTRVVPKVSGLIYK